MAHGMTSAMASAMAGAIRGCYVRDMAHSTPHHYVSHLRIPTHYGRPAAMR
jgi:hypothetical protein